MIITVSVVGVSQQVIVLVGSLHVGADSPLPNVLGETNPRTASQSIWINKGQIGSW